jgi:hypothetical protein
MGDKIKKAAQHIQIETGFPYQTALNILRGDLRPIPQAPDCQVRLAFKTMPIKIRAYLQLPELGEPAEGKPPPKPCTCARCEP